MKIKITEILIDNRACEIFGTNTTDGSFEFPSEKNPKIEICIGFDLGWNDVLEILFHELFEGICVCLNFTYSKEYFENQTSTNRLIILDHNQMNEIVHRAMIHYLKISPIMKRKYKQYHNSKK